MTDPATLILTRVYARLSNGAIGVPVFSEPPSEIELPYAAIDVTVGRGEGVLSVHVWSGYRGEAEALSVLARARALLAERRIVSAQGLAVWCLFDGSRVLIDADGAVRHGIADYKLLIHDTSR